ncbi:Nickel transport system permease protein nikB [Raoultella planticola]|uniref:Nickel transport system permease protein nikB n=1 Tax=Raoultella planticola TaxID=575 RepID=A0A485B8H0_RAOPL|nr:Nickel transport system permease protein nikB [Raoultella planticola]
MQRYLLRRILLLIPMIFAASVIIFLMLRLGTGDPALDYLRLSNLPPTPDMVASTRAMLGLDQPLVVQYGRWLWRALHLDFGVSFATQRPVLDDVLRFLPATLQLAGAALVLILLTSVPLGIWAARHRENLPDFIVRIIAFLGVSMPNFWLAFLLVLFFSVYLQWLPALGYGGWQHIILPAVSIAFMSLAINAPPPARQHAGSRRTAPCHLGSPARPECQANRTSPHSTQRLATDDYRRGNAHWRTDRRDDDHRKYLCLAGHRALCRFGHF